MKNHAKVSKYSFFDKNGATCDTLSRENIENANEKEEQLQKTEINEAGRAACPRCGYDVDADNGDEIRCEQCDEKFVAVAKKDE